MQKQITQSQKPNNMVFCNFNIELISDKEFDNLLDEGFVVD
jgi:hypothetical protein